MLVLEDNAFLYMFVFGANPSVLLVHVRVQLGEDGETFIRAIIISQPAGRFRKEEDEGTQEDGVGNCESLAKPAIERSR